LNFINRLRDEHKILKKEKIRIRTKVFVPMIFIAAVLLTTYISPAREVSIIPLMRESPGSMACSQRPSIFLSTNRLTS